MSISNYGPWKFEIEPVAAAGMYTANATITRASVGDDVGYFRYKFRNIGVSDTEQGAVQWADEWLRVWIDDNA